MALFDVNWNSKSIGKMVKSFVILPDEGQPPFATYYLLHGLSDDYSAWQRRTRIEMYAAGLPIAIVMPDGFHGFYTDNEQGLAYGKYMAEDLVEFIERSFPVRRERSARAIGGLSMGGYGALRLALANPDVYACAVSHSGAVMHGSREWTKDEPWQQRVRRIFGADPRGSKHDLIHLAEEAQSAKKLPALSIDCGTSDFLIADNREYHTKLQGMNIPHQYAEHLGEHNWDYWDLHVRDALKFAAETMGVSH
jgi:putative tributyrin esterase